ncbi:MAG TPA: gas vesicle protein [Candidatus Limnocylindria bacterium]
MSMSRSVAPGPSTSIIDILDRVLDKGLVVAGDISISLANVELLTIRIRLLVCSIDKAEQIGLNWWRYDRNLVAPATASAAGSGVGEGAAEIKRLEQRIADLERTLKSATPKR